VMLFEALGYPLPVFAHLPLVLDERGKKYSKREHGANVLDWRDDGYLPQALINYVALLGWSPEEEGRELFSMAELKDAFDIRRWGKSAARFDRKKLDWLNGQHVRLLPLDELLALLVPILKSAGLPIDEKPLEWQRELAAICQDKLPTLNRIVELSDFFFQDITDYEEKGAKKAFNADGAERLELIKAGWGGIGEWHRDPLKTAVEQAAADREEGLGKWVAPLRLALTGKSVGPGLFELSELLGREACLSRIDRAIEHIGAQTA